MCGLIFLYGLESSDRLPLCLERIKHRGPDDQNSWIQGNVAIGFSRLTINGEGDAGHQPYQAINVVAAFNGEIYNYQNLISQFGLITTSCDTHVILPLFNLLGPKVIDFLDGFYSGVLYQAGAEEIFCLRDHMGKKPLFVGASEGMLFITSELKALDSIDWFKALPIGCSRVDIKTGEATCVMTHTKKNTDKKLPELLEVSVRKRIPQNQPMGLFLSGGLDSSLIAAYASHYKKDITYFILGSDSEPDSESATHVIDALNLQNICIVPLPSPEEISELLRLVVFATESYNPSIVSNGLATYLLARAARRAGIKVVLTGEGADELFGGYHYFQRDEPWRRTRQKLIDDMQFTELRRLDLACMSFGVEARCPFLDRDIRYFSDGLAFAQLYSDDENKVTLRRSFDGILPDKILHRRKTSCDVGSGIRREVVRYLRRNGRSERDELLNIWKQLFEFESSHPYFHAYPVFDAVIDRRGESHR